MAVKLVKRFGVTEESYQKFLEKASECEPPLPDEELEAIWHSACKFGKKVTSQEGYISPEAYGKQFLIPDDFSDVGEARTFVEQYADEVAFTVATDYLRYNGTYWEESEHAVTLAMMEHTDVQLAEAEKQVEAALQTLEHLGIPREAAKTGGKKFRGGGGGAAGGGAGGRRGRAAKSFGIVWTRHRPPHTNSISSTARFRRS